MKTFRLYHAIVMDSLNCILSLLFRIVKNSVLIPCEYHFIFVHCTSGGLHKNRLEALKSLKTLSTARGNENVSFNVIDLRLPDTQKSILQNKIDFSRVNIILFDGFQEIARCFTIDEAELFFIGNDEVLLMDLLQNKCLITPSIAITQTGADLFFKHGIPFKYAEYFREVLFLKGSPDAKLHMKTSILDSESDTPFYHPGNIDAVLTEFFPNDVQLDDNDTDDDA